MVSFLSFFSKKKLKRTSPPTSPNLTQPSSSRPKPAQRFLSLRQKSKSRPYDIAARRSSSEIQRKRSQRQNTRVGDVPRLDLAFEVRAGEGEDEGGLSDLGYGGQERVVEKEMEVLRGMQFGLDDVLKGWKWFGEALKNGGIETPGVMIPNLDVDIISRDRLLILFVLANKPEFTSSFPTFTQHPPKTVNDCVESNIWEQRLLEAIVETPDPRVHAEILKFILRRLDASTSSTSVHAPILEVELYTKFVQAERAARYPKDAYATLLLPRLRVGIGAYLEEVFEVWASIAARSEVNQMSAGKLCLLLGWWLWGNGTTLSTSWNELYEGWMAAGRRVEHLFLAWIRYHSTSQTLPTRLLQLIEAYPYRETHSDEPDFPLPPPSTFARQALHIRLATPALPKPGDKLSPRAILEGALRGSSDVDTSTPVWTYIQSSRDDPGDNLLDPSSRAFISKFARSTLNDAPPEDLLLTPSNKDEGPLYRPFSTMSPNPNPSDFGSRRRSRSYGDAADLQLARTGHARPNSEKRVLSSSARTPGETSDLASPSPQPITPAAWEDFEKIGFADSPEPVKLALSPSTSSIPLSPLTPNNGNGISFAQVPRPREALKQSATKFTLQGEELIEIDDTFIAFYEDGQLDPTSTTTWPTFALLRLVEPITHPSSAKPIEWLLISVGYPPARPEIQPPARSASPGTASTSSRGGSTFGMSNFANSFRRSSSYGTVRPGGGLRKSLFGGSAKSLSKAGGLESLSETSSRAPQASPTSLASVGEMGELLTPSVEIPSSVVPKDDGMDSRPDEWVYKAEGGAHIIFAYIGNLPRYKGKVMRVRKPSKVILDDGSEEALREEWRERQLPRLLPSALLLQSKEIALPPDWAKSLFESAQKDRPTSRIDRDGDSNFGSGPVKAFVMEDLMSTASVEGDSIVCFEIKPKWGFLPSAQYLHPPESIPIKTRNCRFCMHQHLRNPDDSDAPAFCPLDLYSDDEERMRKAIKGLWGLWEESDGTGNNWRVYVDGQIRSPQQNGSSDLSNNSLKENAASWLIPELQHSHVLKVVQFLQSSLDSTDISDLAKQFEAECPNWALFEPEHITSPTQSELNELVNRYLEDQSSALWNLRRKLLAYSLSAIFKDCSIFVQLPMYRNHAGIWEVRDGRSRVKVIDLDLKPITSLRHWYDLDTKIWTQWRDTYLPSVPTVGGLSVTDDESTRAIFTPSGRVTPSSTLAESILPASAAIPGPGEPLLISGLGRSLSVRRSREDSDGISLGGALAISPTKAEFDVNRRPSVGAVAETLESSGPVGAVPVTIRDGSESPVAQRTSRSLAPSPSPQPEVDDAASSGVINHASEGVEHANPEASRAVPHGGMVLQPLDSLDTVSGVDSAHFEQSKELDTIQPTGIQPDETSASTGDAGRAESPSAQFEQLPAPADMLLATQSSSQTSANNELLAHAIPGDSIQAVDGDEASAVLQRDTLSISPPQAPSRPTTAYEDDIHNTPRSAQRASGQTFGGEVSEDAGLDEGVLPSQAEDGNEDNDDIPQLPARTMSSNPFSLGPAISASHSASSTIHPHHVEHGNQHLPGNESLVQTEEPISEARENTPAISLPSSPDDTVPIPPVDSELVESAPIDNEGPTHHPHPEPSPATTAGEYQNEYPFETARSGLTGHDHDPFFTPTGITGSSESGRTPKGSIRGVPSLGSVRSLAKGYDALIDSARSTSTSTNAPKNQL